MILTYQEKKEEIFYNNINLQKNIFNEDKYKKFYISFNPTYKNNNEDITIKYAIENNLLNLDDFIKELEYINNLNDGGSKIYKYNKKEKTFGEESFYVAVCNSNEGIKDIFLSKYKKSLNNKCKSKLNDIKGITFKVKQETLTNTGSDFTIIDNSKEDHVFSTDYIIEKKENSSWKAILPLDRLSYDDIAYYDKILNLHIDWKGEYGELPKGQYRIIKSFQGIKDEIKHYISVEFIIE